MRAQQTTIETRCVQTRQLALWPYLGKSKAAKSEKSAAESDPVSDSEPAAAMSTGMSGGLTGGVT